MREARFRMQYGAPAVLIGWVLTFVLFCVGLTVTLVIGDSDAAMGWNLLIVLLMYGFTVALVLGLPLSLLIAWPLRRVRKQWIHVLGFAVGIGLATALLILLVGGVEAVWQSTVIILAVGICAAIGRASVITMVARRNEVVGESDPAIVARYDR